MKKITCLAALVLGTIGTTALFADEQAPQTEFVFNLYRTIAKSQPDENVMVSPYGVQQLLDLARHGAAGNTRTEIEQVIDYKKSVKWQTPAGDTLSVATALWTQQGYPFLTEFLQTAQEKFEASIEQADFAKNPDAALERLNAWCAEKTKEKIPKILDEIGTDTRLIMVNAIHFVAQWVIPFGEHMTRSDMFILQNGEEVETRFMTDFSLRYYAENDETLFVALPYPSEWCEESKEISCDYNMLLLLPKNAANFAQWESEMTLEKLEALTESMYEADVFLRMPRFEIKSDIDLIPPLEQLGMPKAFSSKEADFSNIADFLKTDDPGLFVSKALQKMYIKVDEEGTKATAVTLIADPISPWRGDDKEEIKIREFIAKRPFLFAIMKDDTILFLGRFVKPDAE